MTKPKYRWNRMQRITLFSVTFLFAMFTITSSAIALSDEESKKLFTKLVHSYYESDAETFFEICSKFEKPLFDNLKDVQRWMDSRMAPMETYLRVRGVVVGGSAKIISEKLGKIVFRFDGSEQTPSRVIVVTAWVKRIIEFDESVPPGRRIVEQEAILKIYATVVEERFITFKSDEINFGYSFANRGQNLSSQ